MHFHFDGPKGEENGGYWKFGVLVRTILRDMECMRDLMCSFEHRFRGPPYGHKF